MTVLALDWGLARGQMSGTVWSRKGQFFSRDPWFQVPWVVAGGTVGRARFPAHSPTLSAFPHPCFVWDDPSPLSWSCAAGWSSGAGAGHCRVSPQDATRCCTGTAAAPGAATTLRWPCVHWQQEGTGFVRAVAPGLTELMGWESFWHCSVGNPGLSHPGGSSWQGCAPVLDTACP